MTESDPPEPLAGQDEARRGRTGLTRFTGDEGKTAEAALAAFETLRDEMNELLCDVRAGDTARARKLAPVASELARAVTRVADEWAKLDSRYGGGDTRNAEMSLDLDAARTEVLGRLARLRDAGG